MATNDTDRVEEATVAEDEHDAAAKHHPDRMPTPEEEEAAERNELDPHAAESYKEAARRGADQQGEGRLP